LFTYSLHRRALPSSPTRRSSDLEEAAHEYFLRSEQIPTKVRLAVAEELLASGDGPRHRWRAGGMLLQFLPKKVERMRGPDLDPRSEEHTSELQSLTNLVCRLLLA